MIIMILTSQSVERNAPKGLYTAAHTPTGKCSAPPNSTADCMENYYPEEKIDIGIDIYNICMHLRMHAYMQACMYTYISMFDLVCFHNVYEHLSKFVCVCVKWQVCECMCVRKSVCVCACMHV